MEANILIPTMKRLPPLLTVTEVSDLLKISRPKVYLLIQERVIYAFKLGADWRIRTQSIRHLLPSD